MDIDTTQTQAQVFCAHWLAKLFHNTPEQLLRLLNRDGNKFLRFYWEQAGKDLPADQLRDSFGLNFVIREPAERTFIALVSLPEPQVAGDPYYIALIFRPNRRLFLVSDTTKMIVMEKAVEDGQKESTPTLIEISRRFQRYSIHGESVEPRLEDFYNAVLDELD
jgi:hypothetical protein